MPLRSMLLRPLCLVAILLGFAMALAAHGETFRNPRRIPLPVDPSGVVAGDLNGDGRNDIVWIEDPPYPGVPALHVLLAGGGGQYTSAPDLRLPSDYAANQCLIEEVTGDKRNDLVCVTTSINSANNTVDAFVVTYAGKGDGTFAAPVQTKVISGQSLLGAFLGGAGDLNGDGLADILVMTPYGGGILPYFSDGLGGFKAGTAFQGSFNSSIPTVTDLNGDGKLDVFWPTGPRVSLGNGDGTFSYPVAYDPGFLSTCAFGDVDHDGHLDAACTWFDGGNIDGLIHLAVLHGNSDGSFSKTPLFTRTFGSGTNEYEGFGTIISPVLVADLNGDGFLDIVSLSGDGYCVLLGGANTTWNGAPQQFVAASFQSEGQFGTRVVSSADMNGDRLPDIVAVGPNGLYITYAQRDGTLSSAPAPEVGQVSVSATLVDVNGDGNLDIVSSGDTSLKLGLGRGDGTFGSPQPITTTGDFGYASHTAFGVISGDFNGDGKQDLLATGSVGVYTSQNYILFGHGDGTFDAPKAVDVALGKVADLNNDGRSDTISIQNNAVATNVLRTSLSRGDGTFTTVSTDLPVEVANGFTALFNGPALADFRHSGHLDVAIASLNNAYLLQGRGDGTFDSKASPMAIPDLPNFTKGQLGDIAAGDFDGDGNPDLAVLQQYGSGTYNLSTPTSAVWVFYGKGDGSFSPAVLAGTFDRHAETLTAGDLNGDGLSDLVLTSYNLYQDDGLLVIHALPNRAWGPETDYTGGEGLSRLWITDINHDGRNDLLVSNAVRANYASNSIAVLLNEPADGVTGTLRASPEPSNVTYPFTVQATLIPSDASANLAGSVTFSVDGIVAGTAALAGNSASLNLTGVGVAAGTHTLSASWPGDPRFPPVTLTGTHTVSLLPLSISLTVSPGSLRAGGTVTAATTFTPGVVPNQVGYQYTGTMTLLDNGVAIAQQQVSRGGFSFIVPSLTVGSHNLSVSYAGDALFSASQSNSVTVIVAGAPSTSTLTATPATSIFGTPVTLSATIAAAGGAPLSSVATGSVIFTIDGMPLPPVALTNAAAGTIVSALAAGSHTVSCSYSGDTTYAPSACNSVPVVVNAAPSALTVTSSLNPSVAYTPVTFTIHLVLNGHSAPAGTQVTFSPMSNSGNFLLTTDANGTATYTTSQLFARTWDTVAIFSGNNYVAAITHYSQVVTAAATTLSLSATPNPAYSGQTVTLSASTTPSGTTYPTGSVTFLEGATGLGSGALDASGRANLSLSTLSVGSHVIVATYSGDSGFLSGSSHSITVVISAADLVLTTDRSSITIQTEHHSTLNVSLVSTGGLTGTFTLACGPLPTWTTCHFSSPTLTLPANGQVGTTLDVDTDAVYHFKSALQFPGTPSQPRSKLPLLALAPLAGCAFCLRRRGAAFRSNLLRSTIPFMLIVLGCLLSGCGDKYPGHTEPGSYAVQVTATSTAGTTPVPTNRTAIFTLLVTP